MGKAVPSLFYEAQYPPCSSGIRFLHTGWGRGTLISEGYYEITGECSVTRLLVDMDLAPVSCWVGRRKPGSRGPWSEVFRDRQSNGASKAPMFSVGVDGGSGWMGMSGCLDQGCYKGRGLSVT